MRTIFTIVFLSFAYCVSGYEFRFENLTGHDYTNFSGYTLPPGQTFVPIDADTIERFGVEGVDGSVNVTVVLSDVYSPSVTVPTSDWGWFEAGFGAGLGVAVFALVLRFARQMGRTAPEI